MHVYTHMMTYVKKKIYIYTNVYTASRFPWVLPFHGHPSIRQTWKNLQASVERWDPTAPLWTKEVGNCQPIATSHDENIPQMVVVEL